MPSHVFTAYARTVLTLTAIVVLTHSAAASESTHEATEAQALPPAKRYSGSAPIDLSNGRVGNNGTYGSSNSEYEAKGKALLTAPSLLASPYPYEEQCVFAKAYEERLAFFEEAIANLHFASEITKPETIEFAKQAATQLQTLLAQAKTSFAAAKGASASQWTQAQESARSSLTALMGTYYSLNSVNK